MPVTQVAEAAVNIQSSIGVKLPLFEETGRDNSNAPAAIIIIKPNARVLAGDKGFDFFLKLGIVCSFRKQSYSISAHSASSPNSSMWEVITTGGLYVEIMGVRSVVKDVRSGEAGVVVVTGGVVVVSEAVISGVFSASCSPSSTFCERIYATARSP